jgi:hypothetical protein
VRIKCLFPLFVNCEIRGNEKHFNVHAFLLKEIKGFEKLRKGLGNGRRVSIEADFGRFLAPNSSLGNKPPKTLKKS